MLYGDYGSDRLCVRLGKGRLLTARGNNDKVDARNGGVGLVDCGPSGSAIVALVDRNDNAFKRRRSSLERRQAIAVTVAGETNSRTESRAVPL